MIGRVDKNGPQGDGINEEVSFTLNTIDRHAVASGYAVRRLTPLECLRLQGFPDYWLDIEGMSDTQKYRSIGNSVAIPCVDFVMSGIARALREGGAIQGQKIDLYMDSEHECLQWGRRQVEVRVIEP